MCRPIIPIGNPAIDVEYSCLLCGLKRVKVAVPQRGHEDVVTWVNRAAGGCGVHHRLQSPQCPARVLDLWIPITGVQRIGEAPES